MLKRNTPNKRQADTAAPNLAASQQKLILEHCVAKNEDLDDMLNSVGLDREALRYEIDTRNLPKSSEFVSLSAFNRPTHHVPLISLFSGCGGLDLGFEAAGYKHVVLVEHNSLFCKTLQHNRPNWRVVGPPVYAGDVSKRTELLEILKTEIKVKVPFEGILAGGPPCQPFSIAANQRFNKSGVNFKRIGFEHSKNGNLLFDMLWLISSLKPAAFLIENVEGLYDVDGGAQIQNALVSLSNWGYKVAEPLVLDAAHYSVPQHRRRLFITGNRLGKTFSPPTPSFHLIPSGSALRLPKSKLFNHEPRLHKADSLIRYMTLDYGQRDHLGRVDRLDPSKPSKTVIAGGTKGGGRSHLHPIVPRTLTVRECARLQTFPDDYEILGPTARQFTQVGNAVPPVLAAQLGKAIYDSYFK